MNPTVGLGALEDGGRRVFLQAARLPPEANKVVGFTPSEVRGHPNTPFAPKSTQVPREEKTMIGITGSVCPVSGIWEDSEGITTEHLMSGSDFPPLPNGKSTIWILLRRLDGSFTIGVDGRGQAASI